MQQAAMHPGAIPRYKTFSGWLKLHRHAAGLSQRALADAVPGTQHTDIHEYEEGCVGVDGVRRPRIPTPSKAYDIGRALEKAFVKRYLAEERALVAAHGSNVPLPEVVTGATNGLDALIVSGGVVDVVGILAEFATNRALMTSEVYSFLDNLFELNVLGETLPSFMYPRLGEAAQRWLKDPNPKRLPYEFEAAIAILENEGPGPPCEAELKGYDWRLLRASEILHDWLPNAPDSR